LAGNVDRATFTLTDTALKVRWNVDANDAAPLAAYLSPAVLRVADSAAGGTTMLLQFIDPERCEFNLAASRKSFAALKPPAAQMRFVPLTRPTGFALIDGVGPRASITFQSPNGASFTLDANSDGLTTNWSEMLLAALNSKRTADDETANSRTPLPKKNSNKDIDTSKRGDKNYEKAFAAYDQAMERAKNLAAIIDDLNRPVRAQLALRLASGVVVATVDVIRENAKQD
jgi:hypothetical protein